MKTFLSNLVSGAAGAIIVLLVWYGMSKQTPADAAWWGKGKPDAEFRSVTTGFLNIVDRHGRSNISLGSGMEEPFMPPCLRISSQQKDGGHLMLVGSDSDSFPRIFISHGAFKWSTPLRQP